jgi:hypothetical protein
MKTKVLLIGAILLLALSVAYAADVTGKWAAEMQGRNGPTTTTFTFKADGAKLTGTMQGAQGDPVEIQEGKMEGDNISFVTVRKMGEMEMKSEWKGTVAGDEMKLTRTMVPPPGGFGPPPGGGAPGAGGPPPGAGAPGGAPAGGPGAGPGGGGRGMGGPTEIIAKRVK